MKLNFHQKWITIFAYFQHQTNDKTKVMPKQNNRRNFIKKGSIDAAGFFIVPRHVIGKGYTAPSDKLNIAAIGAGGKGQSDLFNSYNNGANKRISFNIKSICFLS